MKRKISALTALIVAFVCIIMPLKGTDFIAEATESIAKLSQSDVLLERDEILYTTTVSGKEYSVDYENSPSVMAEEDNTFTLDIVQSELFLNDGEFSTTIVISGNGTPTDWTWEEYNGTGLSLEIEYYPEDYSNDDEKYAYVYIDENSVSYNYSYESYFVITASNGYHEETVELWVCYEALYAWYEYMIVEPEETEYKIGDEFALAYARTTKYSDGTTGSTNYIYNNLNWSSSNDDVAVVDEYGRVTITGYGTADIGVSYYEYGSQSDSISISVKEPYINISGNSTCYIGNEYKYTCSTYGCSDITWSVDYGTITQDGELTPTYNTSVITATAVTDDGTTISDTFYVSCYSKATYGEEVEIYINASEEELYVGNTISFYYNNSNVDHVSVSGGEYLGGDTINLTKAGTVTVYVSGNYDTEKANVSVHGDKSFEVKSMPINLKSPSESQLYVGNKFYLSYENPENYKNLTWSSSNESVATVSNSGYVTINDYGAAKIYVNAESKYGEAVSDYVTILVEEPICINLIQPDTSDLYAGKSFSIGTISGDIDSIEWISSNSSVASVDDNGTVTINGAGKVTVTVNVISLYSEMFTDSVTFVVYDSPVIQIVKPSTDDLFVSNIFALEYESRYSSQIVWTSSNTAVAEIDSYGNVQLNGTGSVTIYAQAYNVYGFSAEDSVTFTVSESNEPTAPVIIPSSVSVVLGESIELECVNISDGTSVKFFSDNTDIAEVSDGTVIGKQLGTTVIYAIIGSTVCECIVNVVTENLSGGDVNADGVLDESDLVMLRNYLLGTDILPDPNEADLTSDGVIDIFDMVLMRDLLI